MPGLSLRSTMESWEMCCGRSLKCSSLHKFYHDPHDWNQSKGISNLGISLGTSWWGVTREMPGPHGGIPGKQGDAWLTCEHRIYNFCQGKKGEITHGVNQSSSESMVKPKSSKSNMYLVWWRKKSNPSGPGQFLGYIWSINSGKA